MKQISKLAALEQLQSDYENRNVLLESVPEVCPVSGNPKRKMLEQMMLNTITLAKGGLALPQGAMEAGDTVASDVPSTISQVMPILSAAYPQEVAFDLVINVPMDRPTGLVNWIVEKYGSAEAGSLPDAIAVGDRVDQKKTYNISDQATEGDDSLPTPRSTSSSN